MAKKERDPDLQFPDEAAIEEHVREMMEPAATPADSSKATKITVTHHEDAAPETAAKPTSKITVNRITEESEPASAPPLLPDAPDESPPVSSKLSPKKSIAITHFSDEPTVKLPTTKSKASPKTSTAASEPEPLPETVKDPLIPTDKLAETVDPTTAAKPITSKKPAKKSTKKGAAKPKSSNPVTKRQPESSKKSISIAVTHHTDADEQPSAEPSVAVETTDEAPSSDTAPATDQPSAEETDQSADELDAEIANAFGELPSDELDELAAETPETPEENEETPTPASAPELPAASVERTTESESKPKFDKFKPLTNIRPQLPPDDKKRLNLKLDDVDTGKLVDEITVNEADSLLNLPSGKGHDFRPRPATKAQLKRRHSGLLHTKGAHRTAVVLVILALLVAAGVPFTRATALNLMGIRTTATVTVLDQSTGQPLKNVIVTAENNTALTDAGGQATIHGLKLGRATININRQAYAPVTATVSFGWRAAKLAAVSLVPTGNQHSLLVTDYLTGKPVKAILDSSLGSASADGSGLIKLTIDKSQTKPFAATVSAPGYRSEQLTIDPGKADNGSLALVLSSKYVYAIQSGNSLNIYRSDFDGQNQQLLLKGTGNEQAKTTFLVPSQSADEAALVSVRTSNHAADGSAISNLTLLDLASGITTSLAEGSQLQIIGWIDEHLVYTIISTNAASTDASRQKLVSYNYKTKQSQTLASANYFNNVLEAGNKLYYASSSAYQATGNVGFFVINADGTGKQAILPLETWNVYRTSFDHLSLSVQQDWYDLKIGNQLASKRNGPPDSLANLQYVESPDGQHGLRVVGSGSGAALVVYDESTGKETNLVSENGVTYPVRWLNNSTVVYRVDNNEETADYVYNLDNGNNLKKIQNVVNVLGTTPWQIH